MSENVVTINPEKLGKTIRSYILVYEDEIPEAVDMAITLLVEAAQQMRGADSSIAHVACPQCAWLFEIKLPA